LYRPEWREGGASDLRTEGRELPTGVEKPRRKKERGDTSSQDTDARILTEELVKGGGRKMVDQNVLYRYCGGQAHSAPGDEKLRAPASSRKKKKCLC